MPDREDRAVRDLGEGLVEQHRVFAGAPGLRRLGRRSEPGQIDDDRFEASQRGLEIVAITAPAVQAEYTRRRLAEHIGEQAAVRECPQHGFDDTGADVIGSGPGGGREVRT